MKNLIAIVVTLFAVNNAFAGDGTTVGGFADAQLHIDNPSEGFSVHDGAVYLNHQMGNTSGTVDIPFSAGAQAAAGLVLGGLKGQAFVSHKYDNGVRWKLGMWDTPFVKEPNDTVNVMFTRRGLAAGTSPFTHQGLTLGWANDMVGFDAVIANPDDATVVFDRNTPDFGAVLTVKQDMMHGKVAFLANSNKTTGTSESGHVLDLAAGVNVDKLTWDVEFLMRKNAITGASAFPTLGTSVSYAMNEWTFGARFEYAMKSWEAFALANPAAPTAVPAVAATTFRNYAGTTDDKGWQLTVGPQCQMTKNLKVRLDFTAKSLTPMGAAAATNTSMTVLSAVYSM